jgi:hypothetical protein
MERASSSAMTRQQVLAGIQMQIIRSARPVGGARLVSFARGVMALTPTPVTPMLWQQCG